MTTSPPACSGASMSSSRTWTPRAWRNFRDGSFDTVRHDPGPAGRARARCHAGGNAAPGPGMHHHLPQLCPLATALVPDAPGPHARVQHPAVHLVQYAQYPPVHLSGLRGAVRAEEHPHRQAHGRGQCPPTTAGSAGCGPTCSVRSPSTGCPVEEPVHAVTTPCPVFAVLGP